MRILLLGATGFVGQHLLPGLSANGHQCVVLCRNPARSRELRLIPGVQLYPLKEFTRDTLIPPMTGAHAVINLVGILNEKGRNGEGFRRVHVDLVEQVLAACETSGVRRFIHMSALNAGQGKSHYLTSKGEAEDLIRQVPHLDATFIRPSVIFGDGDSFFNRFAGLLRLTPVLPLACPGALMQPVWVDDVAAAITLAVERTRPGDKLYGQALELVGPRVYTLKELVRQTARFIGARRWIIGLPKGLSRLQGSVMDFVPGKPFSSDNFQSLQLDSTSKHNALPRLGITPASIDSIVPGYLIGSRHQHRLDQFRRSIP